VSVCRPMHNGKAENYTQLQITAPTSTPAQCAPDTPGIPLMHEEANLQPPHPYQRPIPKEENVSASTSFDLKTCPL